MTALTIEVLQLPKWRLTKRKEEAAEELDRILCSLGHTKRVSIPRLVNNGTVKGVKFRAPDVIRYFMDNKCDACATVGCKQSHHYTRLTYFEMIGQAWHADVIHYTPLQA